MNEHINEKGQEAAMSSQTRSRFGRRDFLRRGAVLGAAAGTGTAVGGALLTNTASSAPGGGLAQPGPLSPSVDYSVMGGVRLMVTDGWFSFPGRRHDTGTPLYGFGFRALDNIDLAEDDGELDVNPGVLIDKYKGFMHWSSPTIIGEEGVEFAIVVTNLGFIARPDLDDSHTLHWHGFRNATAVFDGVPETSIAVPSGRDLPYFFDPKVQNPAQPKGSAGTYMYHCHFEDVEHVQMGMTGIVFVEPRDMWFQPDGVTNWEDSFEVPAGPTTQPYGRQKVAYNLTNGDGVAHGIDVSFQREFALLMNEIDTRPHDLLEAVQDFVWTDYKADWWNINGRSYPDTVVPQIIPTEVADATSGTNAYPETADMPADFGLAGGPGANSTVTDIEAEGQMRWQPNSSLVQCMEGERVLLRIANLGYEVHSIELVGCSDLDVVGHDASLLVSSDGTNGLNYVARRIELGPGESRDAIFTAPAFDSNPDVVVDDVLAARVQEAPGMTRKFNRYILRSRNNHRNTNGGEVFGDGPSYAGLKDTYGGMVTEVWVYPSSGQLGSAELPDQVFPNETYPTLVVPAGHV